MQPHRLRQHHPLHIPPEPGEDRRAKIRRYTYDEATQQLKEPQDVLTGLPHGPDHGASRLVYGPDGKLYLTARDGRVTVVQAGREFKVLSVNELGED